jgi:predicted DNA-binding WGR domain protein
MPVMWKNKTKRPVYWEYKDGESSKFWAAHIIKQPKPDNTPTGELVPRFSGTATSAVPMYYVLIRKWGRIGTKGQKMEQTFNDIYQAEKALDVLIREKQSKGYKPIF